MSYIVTARKWRPKVFTEVVGQEHISTTLKNAIRNNRLAHAYLFAGPRGVGKTTTARILAKTLNCLNIKDGEPCNDCAMCNSFNTSQSLDIIEIDGASNRRIEEIRTLRESVKYAPTKGQYKIYIIDEVHMLTTESFNALLKTLEEPPEHTIFIFATTDVHKVPLTIISRCQRFDFRRIELKLIKEQLTKISASDGIKIDDESLTIIAKKADGALRDAESLFDQVISFCGTDVNSAELKRMLNLIDEEIYFEITDAILCKNFTAAFDITAKIYDRGWSFIDFLNGLTEHFRNLLTITIRGNSDLIESAELFKKRYLEYIDKFSESDLLRILTFLNKIQYEIKSSQNQRLKIEISLSQLIGLERTSTLTELIERAESGDLPSSAKTNLNPSSAKISDEDNKKKTEVIREAEAEPYKAEELEIRNSAEAEQNPVSKIIPNKPDREINSDWDSFVDFIARERSLFASNLSQTKPISVSENTLELECLPEDEDLLIGNSNFLKQKIKAFFNLDLRLKFTASKINSGDITYINSDDENDSPLAQLIKKELGGREWK